MKTIWIREDGTITDSGDPTAFEYVPAEVAQQLYDIVAKLVEHGAWYPSAIELDTFGGPQGEDLEHEAKTALAAADGEEV